MARKPKKSSTRRTIDMASAVIPFDSDIETEVVVLKAEWKDGDKGDYLDIELGGTGEYEGATMYHRCFTTPKSLHRTRNFLEALGMDVPDGAFDIDSDELIDMRCMCHTFEEEYTNAEGVKGIAIRADDFWPVDEGKSAKSKPAAKGGKASAKSKKKDEVERADIEAMDRDELIELIEEHSLDVDATSRKLKKDDDALLAAVLEAAEEQGLIEPEEEVKEEPKKARGKKAEPEEDEEKPSGKAGRSKPGKAGSKGKSKTWSEEGLQEMNEDELEEVVEASGVDIDLSEHKTLRKKRNVLIDALEEAEKLDS